MQRHEFHDNRVPPRFKLGVPSPFKARNLALAAISVYFANGEYQRPAAPSGIVPIFDVKAGVIPNNLPCGPREVVKPAFGIACNGKEVPQVWFTSGVSLKFDNRTAYMPEWLAPLFHRQSDEICRQGVCWRVSHDNTSYQDRTSFYEWRNHMTP